jgi:eukaryotic-like serine/threonine-protein kinase
MSARMDDRVEQLFLASLTLLPAERARFLDEECGADTALHAQVSAKLATAERADQYFRTLSERISQSSLGQLDEAASKDADSRNAAAGTVIGGYRLLREIGRGGMASVWLAERTDGMVNRPVALKFPHGAWLMPGLAERMKQERDILAHLEHQNIARLYDAGVTQDGRPYLAIEFVEGEAIDRYCETRALALAPRLRLLLQVSRAVAYAHAQLVVHRDIKPSNVLVTEVGEVRLLDFGIAKLLAQDAAQAAALTSHTGRALTIDYAAPEQILGQPISIAADVYSLGVLAFEMLAGRRPYKLSRESRGALEDAILQADAPRPSEVATVPWSRELRGDLDTIILKALKKQPSERYETVNAFIEDIERHLDSRPVLARPDSSWYRVGRLIARNRIAFGAASVTLAAIVSGAAVALVQAHTANLERARAEDINAFITSILERTDPFHDAGAVLTGAQLLRRAREDLSERFVESPDRRVELLNVIGAGLISVGDLDEARITLEQSLNESRAAFGGEDAYSVHAQVLLAEIMNSRRDTQGTRAALLHLLPAAREHLADHPETLVRALKLQSDVALELGEYRTMRGPVQEALAIAEGRLGPNHRLTYAARSLLAQSQVIHPDSIDEMLRVTETMLAKTIATHPRHPDHSQIVRMREIHARALGVAGRIRESVEQTRATVSSLQRLIGPESPVVANTKGSMAAYERRLGEIDQSLASSDFALRYMEGRIERVSRDFANMLMTRGVTYLVGRQPGKAEQDLAEARASLEALFGPRHWDSITAQLNFAAALAYLGRFAEAERLLEVTGDPSVEIQYPWWAEHQRGIVKRLSGNPEEAVRAQKKALSLIPVGARAPWDRVRALAELGASEFALGRSMEAARALSEAQALFEELEISMHPPYAETLTARGALLLDSDATAALTLLEKAADYWEKGDANNTFGGEAAYWLARCYRSLGRLPDAEAQASRARRLLASSPLERDQRLLRQVSAERGSTQQRSQLLVHARAGQLPLTLDGGR